MDHLTQLAQFTIDDARALLPQWQQALRAEAKSPGTIDTYTHGLQTYLTWCARTFEPPLARATMTTWMSDMLEAGAAPGSVRIRQLAVRRFVAWLIDTGHLPVDPFAGVKGPRQTEKPVTPLTDDDLRALIATCDTPTLAPASRSITAATRRSSGSCSRPASASERLVCLSDPTGRSCPGNGELESARGSPSSSASRRAWANASVAAVCRSIGVRWRILAIERRDGVPVRGIGWRVRKARWSLAS